MFMAAAFLGDYLDAGIVSPSTIGSRLRKLFALAEKTNMDKTIFLAKMEAELLRRDEPMEGGGPRKRAREISSSRKGQREGSTSESEERLQQTVQLHQNGVVHTEDPVDPLLEARATQTPLPMLGNSQDVTIVTSEDDQGHLAPRYAGRMMQDVLAATLNRRQMNQVYTRQLGHYLMALGLLSVGDGIQRSLEVTRVGMRMYRLKKKGESLPTNVEEALEREGATVFRWGPRQPSIGHVNGALYVSAAEGAKLPFHIRNATFVLGARPVTVTVDRRSFSSYEFTTDEEQATVAVYLPGSGSYEYMRGAQATAPTPAGSQATNRLSSQQMPSSTPARAPPSTTATTPAMASTAKKRKVGDLQAALDTEPRFPLNAEGSLGGAPRVCPRSWQLHDKRPHHVSEASWLALTEEVRQRHIACLKNLKNMPFEL
eukprot:gene7111-biopygen4375